MNPTVYRVVSSTGARDAVDLPQEEGTPPVIEGMTGNMVDMAARANATRMVSANREKDLFAKNQMKQGLEGTHPLGIAGPTGGSFVYPCATRGVK